MISIRALSRGLLGLALGGVLLGSTPTSPANAAFAWNTCGLPSDPIQVHSLSITPDPVVLNQMATVSENVTVASAVKRTTITAAIERKVFGVWVEIPGSYTLQVNLKQGTYALSGIPIYVPDPNVSWFTTGDYYTKLVTTDQQGTRLNCTEVYFSIGS